MLPWLDAMLEADEEHFKNFQEPLWSSHMVDFSAEDKDWNIKTCQHYLKRMAPMKLWLEMVII
jgi:fructose-bisphosphate aldolase class II